MNDTKKQHIQVPNDLAEIEFISPKDQLVYTAIRKFMNKDTFEAFPSLDTIHKLTGIYVGGIRKAIDRLQQSGFIEIRKEGKRNIYKFTKPDKFEPFSYEFLEKEDLTTNEKAYLVATQQFMFKEDGRGVIQMSEKEIGEKINMSKSEVNRVNNSLIKKDYMHTIALPNQAGEIINNRVYNLDKLGQAIVFVLKNHEDRIQTNEREIDELKAQNEELMKRIVELEKLTKLNRDLIMD